MEVPRPAALTMRDRKLVGEPASPGLYRGRLHMVRTAPGGAVAVGDPASESARLRRALAEAASDLAVLAGKVGGEGADILEFQIVLIEDDALSESAFGAIESGEGAAGAWRSALDAEIRTYSAAGDETHRTRISDLIDLRDRVLRILSGAGAARMAPAGAILVAVDLQPSFFLAHDWSEGGAVLLAAGSATSHVAILARAKGIPMITGVAIGEIPDGVEAIVDGTTGEAVIDPGEATRSRFDAEIRAYADRDRKAQSLLMLPAHTADGTAVAVHVNISDLTEIEGLDPAMCDGIGLVRTEFLFRTGQLPDEDRQFAAYRRLVEWARGRPTTIRTLDAGGDKPIPGLTADGESNPFLGVRGIRLSLARPDVFRVQIRALLRAAVHGPVKIMLPMVTVAREIEAARSLIAEELASLRHAGVAASLPAIGMMVEVPAAAVAIETFDAEFYSIGSNDLTQYATAAGRDIAAVADLADSSHPGVLRLIEMVTHHGRESGREVSLCGEAGSDVRSIAPLLRVGLRSISVTPAAVARVKSAIAAVTLLAGAAGGQA